VGISQLAHRSLSSLFFQIFKNRLHLLLHFVLTFCLSSQSLISGRPPEKPLMIRVLRGSNVLQQHEDALMEICMSDSADDKSWESCVITSVHSYDENQVFEDEKMTLLCAESEDETGCLLTAIWGEESLVSVEEPSNSGEDEKFSSEEQQSPKKSPMEVAPWSSRSSPSGTYAHNPKTSKIERID
jgi:hypothetical protein